MVLDTSWPDLTSIKEQIDRRDLSSARQDLIDYIREVPESAEAFFLLAKVQTELGLPGPAAAARKRAAQLEILARGSQPSIAAGRYRSLAAGNDGGGPPFRLDRYEFGPLNARPVPGGRIECSTSLCGEAVLRVYPQAMNKLFRKEKEYLSLLTSRNLQSAPRLLASGALPDKGSFAILSAHRADRGGFGLADLFLALLEHRSAGLYPGHLGAEAVSFDAVSGICRFAYYGLASVLPDEVLNLTPTEYLTWCRQMESDRISPSDPFSLLLSPDRNENWMWEENRLNLLATRLFRQQRMTSIPEPSVQSLDLEAVFLHGSRRLRRQKEILDQVSFADGESVLDIGCGLGACSQHLATKGCRVTGVDVEERVLLSARMAAGINRTKVDFQLLDLDFADPPGSPVNTLLLFAVLHHCRNRELVLNRLARLAARRILIECAPQENGFKWLGRWYQKMPEWSFDCEENLVLWLESGLPGYHLAWNFGPTDLGRSVYLFEREVPS